MQRVFEGSLFSETKYINAGVPQDSDLGTLYFYIIMSTIKVNL
jgi:hypothetical protein